MRRLSKATAEKIGSAAELNAKIVLSATQSVVRLGAIPVQPLAGPPRIASLE